MLVAFDDDVMYDGHAVRANDDKTQYEYVSSSDNGGDDNDNNDVDDEYGYDECEYENNVDAVFANDMNDDVYTEIMRHKSAIF